MPTESSNIAASSLDLPGNFIFILLIASKDFLVSSFTSPQRQLDK